MVENERNYAEAERQRRYELHLENVREYIAKPIGEVATAATNLSLTPITLGIIEAPQPYAGEFQTKAPEAINDTLDLYTRPLGERGLAQVINLANRRPTPREALRALPEAA